MADSPLDPASARPRNDAAASPGTALNHRTPRWVKVFGIIALILVLLFVILHLTGHQPFDHTMSDHAMSDPTHGT